MSVRSALKKDTFGEKRIDKVRVLDAKEWIVGLQKKGKGYSSIHSIRGVLRPAFALAAESDFIRKNPFDFELKEVLINDSSKRDAVEPSVEKRFLDFGRMTRPIVSAMTGCLSCLKPLFAIFVQ